MKNKPLNYLCTVYSSHPEGLDEAYLQACRISGTLMKRGEKIFCPIAHGHTQAKLCNLPTEFDWWMDIDETFLDHCDEVIVALMPNWDTSKGITHEIAYAKARGMPIKYLNVETMEFIDENI